MTVQKYRIQGIDCAACAKELEEEIGKLEGVSACTLQFGVISRLQYEVHDKLADQTEAKMRKIIEDDQDHPIIEKDEVETVHCDYTIDGIDCAACAAELEEEIGKLDGVSSCKLTFGIHSRLSYDVEKTVDESVEKKMRKIVEDDQDHPIIVRLASSKTKRYDYRIHLIDCADCAQKLCELTKKIDGVMDADVDFMNEKLSFTCAMKDRSRIEKAMIEMIKAEEPEVEVSVYQQNIKEEVREESHTVMIVRLVAGAVLFVAGMLLEGMPSMICAIASYIILGYDVLIRAVRNILRGNWFDEHFLMGIATLAAIWLRDYKEAAGVMLFYQIGEFFQELAVARSRKSIGELMDIRPDSASVYRDGTFEKVDPEEVAVGEIIQVKPGERIPLDGTVVKGASSLDTSSLTGESRPVDVDEGDEVISGSINQTGLLEICVTSEYGDSTVARILNLVENNDTNKAEHEKFITKFSHYYTPIVVISAVILAVIVSVVTGNVQEGVYRACTFLVISCPCALVISIPLSFFAGIGGLSSRGILVKGANVIDVLAKTDQIVFDKTGTLTSGRFAVEKTEGTDDPQQLIEYAAIAESHSNHPIGEGIRHAYGKNVDPSIITEISEIPGRGIRAVTEKGIILAGNARLMEENGITPVTPQDTGTYVHVANNGKYEGCLILKDQLKEDAVESVKQLHSQGRKCAIVSGDAREITEEIGNRLGVDAAYGSCMPEDKVAVLKKLKENGNVIAFVGDGVNDAPVLANADVSFAMGGAGSDAAIETADVVLMDDRPSAVSVAIDAAKRILNVANQNIIFAIGIKVLTLILGAFGIASMWMAIFADTGVAMLCVLNSMRLLHLARKQ